jgi:hypothetical protein
MLRFILGASFFFLSFLLVHAQSNKSVDPLGLYFGGQAYGETMNGIGYYYFKPDSTFIFIRTGFNYTKAKAFKDRFNDTLVGYGKGRWFLEDSFLITKFEPLLDENILQGEIKYNTYTKAPFDSLFLKVDVTNYDEPTMNIALVTLGNRMIGNPAGQSGYREVVLPLHYNQYKLRILKLGYKEQTITLQNGYNVHEIKITLTPEDSSMIDVVAEVKIPYKIHYQNKEILNGNLKKQNEGKEKLMLFVKNGINKFPRQVALLQKIMSELD